MKHILDLFEETVKKHPDKKALGYKDESCTFKELKDNACTLALSIEQSMGRGKKDQAVAVMVNRGIKTVTAFLAVLYSGNYYVPVDPSMPLAKMQTLIDDCEAKVLVYEEENEALVKELRCPGVSLLFSRGLENEGEFCGKERDPESPIYMVYTSGSTGKPKGVLKSHKAVASFIKAYTEEFSLNGDIIIGNQTPFFFDASAKDLFLMIYTGATMEVIPSELFMFPPKLIEYLNDKQISFICWVPTALAMVTQINTFKSVMPLYLKQVFFVGEVFPIKQLKKWLETLPELSYVNLYGSTEIAGISCYYKIDPKEEIDILPMGKALANCKVFLYDNETKKVIEASDTASIGEVCVSSEALALEYYHDPEKTEAVFVTMPLGNEGENARVLKTGDLARYDAKGNLVFASRKDFQIKHMGRRIELGEIESVADKLPDIVRCCCLYDQEKKRIRLFCQLIDGCEKTGKDIKEELKLHLTDYMVPNVVKVLEEMPLNANGKINRTLLKEMK